MSLTVCNSMVPVGKRKTIAKISQLKYFSVMLPVTCIISTEDLYTIVPIYMYVDLYVSPKFNGLRTSYAIGYNY